VGSTDNESGGSDFAPSSEVTAVGSPGLNLLDSMLDGYALCRMLYDDEGAPRDFVYLEINPAFEELTGLRDVVGRPVSDVIPGIHESNPELLALYGRVARGGERQTFESYLPTLRRWFAVSVYRPSPDHFVSVFENITERKRTDRERESVVEFLRLLSEGRGMRDLVERVLAFVRSHSGCDAVGIRLRDGDDFPYYETRGFPPEFVAAERYLCARDAAGDLVRDAAGDPVVDCMCGNVVRGRFDPAQPFFTAAGSFCSNGTSAMLAATTDADRLTHTRNRCNGDGYESVLLVALRSGEEPLGLLQLNDKLPDAFTPHDVALWERLAGYLAAALAKVRAEEGLIALTERLRGSLAATVAALAAMTELRDPYTAGHQRRVAELACAIAAELGWNESRIEPLRTAALLHDIGKIVVPAEILAKPSRLNDAEMQLVQQHAGAAADAIAAIDFGSDVATMIVQHHERLDGSGYPGGLRGDEIVPEARLIGVADVVEAMSSHRPYRAALPIAATLAELADGAGSRYDAALCDVVIALFREERFTFSE
jgi:putative nucleotidyltransferase with HDIG domain